jgi:hypothetical protein
MSPSGSIVRLVGQTIDAGPFEGQDSVEVIQAPTDVVASAELRLALMVPSPQRQGTFTVYASMPKPGTAKLEVFDVTGRRVLTQPIAALTPQRQAVRLGNGNGIASGLYLVRVVQQDATATARVVLMQ